MKYLRGSVSVVFLFISIAFCSVLFAAVLDEMNTKNDFDEKFISDQTICLQIVSKGQGHKFTYGDIAEFIERHREITIFRTNYFDHSLDIYTPHSDMISELYIMTDGEDFTAEQLISGKHIVLISDNAALFAHDNNGRRIYSHRNREYTVSGSITHSQFDCIAPIYTALQDEYDRPVSDMIYINAGDNTQAVVNEFRKLILSIDGQAEVNIGSENSGFGSSEAGESGVIAIILIALVAVIILCMDSVTEYWAGTRRSELFVRLLSGADHITGTEQILTDFLIVSTMSVCIGALFAVITIRLGLFGLSAAGFTPLYFASVFLMALSVFLGTTEVYLRFRKMSDEPIYQLRC